jgi:hypothetical protein
VTGQQILNLITIVAFVLTVPACLLAIIFTIVGHKKTAQRTLFNEIRAEKKRRRKIEKSGCYYLQREVTGENVYHYDTLDSFVVKDKTVQGLAQFNYLEDGTYELIIRPGINKFRINVYSVSHKS